MNSISNLEALVQSGSLADLENIFNVVKSRVIEIKAAEIAEDRQTVAILRAKHGDEALGLVKPKTKTSKSAKSGAKKYRHPDSGVEWSGSGGVPSWAGGNRENLERFLNPAWVAEQPVMKTKEAVSASALSLQDDVPVHPIVMESNTETFTVEIVEKIPAAINQLTTTTLVESVVEIRFDSESISDQRSIAVAGDEPFISPVLIPADNRNIEQFSQAA